MEVRLTQAEERILQHEEHYLSVWHAIKKPNETLLESCMRVIQERDALKAKADINRNGMAKAQKILDPERWAGSPLIEAVLTELEEAREALAHIHKIACEMEAKNEGHDYGPSAMMSIIQWSSGILTSETAKAPNFTEIAEYLAASDAESDAESPTPTPTPIESQHHRVFPHNHEPTIDNGGSESVPPRGSAFLVTPQTPWKSRRKAQVAIYTEAP
jgi:hypothetical protein